MNQPVVTDPVVETPIQVEPENLIDTSDWKTYRNEEYGFEVKYPKEWNIKKSMIGGVSPVFDFISPELATLLRQHKVDYFCDISIRYYPSILNESENTDGATNLKDMISQNHMITPIGPALLGGENATEVIRGGYGAYYTLLSLHKNHLYEVFFCNRESKEKLNDIDKEILSNFKFMK